MPVAIDSKRLTEDVINDNHKWDIPQVFYDKVVVPLTLREDLRKYGIVDPSLVSFNPDHHLMFTDDYFNTTKRITLDELGVVETHQAPISNIGVSEPFPMFTPEAVAIMRWEIFQEKCMMKCGRLSDHTTTGDMDIMIRGYAKQHAPFTFQAWTHPRVMEIVSKMAGVELVHVMENYEVAQVNMNIKQADSKVNTEKDEEIVDKMPGIVPWHFDSYQAVCVLMLSDTSNMIGGETALVKSDGEVMRVEGPKQGWCTVLQGRILKHIATKPRGDYTERIASVSSYRPKDMMLDESVLGTVRPSALSATRHDDFYREYMDYRLDVLSDRIVHLKKEINDTIGRGDKFDQLKTIEFIQRKIVEYVEHTWQEFEVVDDGLVEKPQSYNVKQIRWG